MRTCLFVVALQFLASTALFAGWTTPQLISGVSSSYHESGAFISNDGLTLYFDRGDTPEHYWFQLYKATRNSTSEPFTNATKIQELGASAHVAYPWVSPDNLTMYYYITASNWHIMKSTRANESSLWSPGQVLSEFDYLRGACNPRLTSNELNMVFDNGINGTSDLYIAYRPNKNYTFAIRALTELNTSAIDGVPQLSEDGLTIYFNSNRSGIGQVFRATRDSVEDQFSAPTVISGLDGYGFQSLSSDGKTMYLAQNWDIYVSTYVPEPASMTLLLTGCACMLLRRRTSNKNDDV
jgi:Tol biopolymer transport system component